MVNKIKDWYEAYWDWWAFWCCVIILLCVVVIFSQSALAQAPPESIVPLGRSVPTFMQCTRNPAGILSCLPVRLLPSVRSIQQSNSSIVLSGPDPAKSLWVQAQAPIIADYVTDAAIQGALAPMPVNYYCINLSPALGGSGAAVLMFDARVHYPIDDTSLRITGLISANGQLQTQTTISNSLSAAVAWPGTFPWHDISTGTVHYYPIGIGCRNFPAISFDSLFRAQPPFTIDDVNVFVSIP